MPDAISPPSGAAQIAVFDPTVIASQRADQRDDTARARATAPATILWLPAELILQIGSYLPDQILFRFARACRAARRALLPETNWRHAAHIAGRVHTVPEFRQALAAAGACRLSDRTQVYCALASRARAMPAQFRREAIASLFRDARPGSADGARIAIALLDACRHRKPGRSDAALMEVEARLHAMMESLAPPDRGALMDKYLAVVRDLPAPLHHASHWIETVSGFRPEEAAATLAAALRWIFPIRERDRREAAFDMLLQAAQGLCAADGRAQAGHAEQAALLSALIRQLLTFGSAQFDDCSAIEDQCRRWEAAYAAVQTLPWTMRAPLLCLLEEGLDCCSSDRHDIQRHWHRLLDATRDGAPTQRCDLLCSLALALNRESWGVDDMALWEIEEPSQWEELTAIAAAAHRLVDAALTLPSASRATVLSTVAVVLQKYRDGANTPMGPVKGRLAQLRH